MILWALAFLLLAVSVSLILIANRTPWYIKLIPVVLLPWLAFAVWKVSQPPQGWPAPISLPSSAEFQWGVIREPNAPTHDKGEIDIWAVSNGAQRPRAYQLPYSRQMHVAVQRALDQVRRGASVRIKQQQMGASGRPGSRHPRGKYIFYQEPPTVLPRKR